MSNDYDNITKLLKAHGFHPAKYLRQKKEGLEQLGLYISCPATILMNDKVNKLVEILGDQWEVTPYSNLGEIYITKKSL